MQHSPEISRKKHTPKLIRQNTVSWKLHWRKLKLISYMDRSCNIDIRLYILGTCWDFNKYAEIAINYLHTHTHTHILICTCTHTQSVSVSILIFGHTQLSEELLANTIILCPVLLLSVLIILAISHWNKNYSGKSFSFFN